MPFFYGYRAARRSEAPTTERPKNSESSESIDGPLIIHQVPKCEITEKGHYKKELRVELQIFARPERLWQLVIRDSKFASNKIADGEKISRRLATMKKISVDVMGKNGGISQVDLTCCVVNSELAWKQRKSFIPGLYEIETSFEIVPHVEENGTTLVQRRVFSGLLVPFLNRTIEVARRDLQLSSVELKDRAENIG